MIGPIITFSHIYRIHFLLSPTIILFCPILYFPQYVLYLIYSISKWKDSLAFLENQKCKHFDIRYFFSLSSCLNWWSSFKEVKDSSLNFLVPVMSMWVRMFAISCNWYRLRINELILVNVFIHWIIGPMLTFLISA